MTNNIPNRKEAKARRQSEAAERQEKYNALSDEEKAERNPKKLKKGK